VNRLRKGVRKLYRVRVARRSERDENEERQSRTREKRYD
jgi:hypothetical protein